MTSNLSAIRFVYSSKVASVVTLRFCGGSIQALSPEWTPASSTCSIIPPMNIFPSLSRIASTSTSVASSKNRSTSTGRSADNPPSRPKLPCWVSSFIASLSCSSSYTMLIARPPRTYEGRISTGYPTRSTIDRASSKLTAVPPGGCGISSCEQTAFQRSRSSAKSIEFGEVPAIMSEGNVLASFKGVCPPRPTITPAIPGPLARLADSISTSRIFLTSSSVNGSKNNRSLVS